MKNKEKENNKKRVCLYLSADKIQKLKMLSHEISLKSEKEVGYIDLIRIAIDEKFFNKDLEKN